MKTTHKWSEPLCIDDDLSSSVEAAFTDWANFSSRPHVVKARRMETAFQVERAGAVMVGEAGDVLVIDLDGQPLAVPAAVFALRYETTQPQAHEVSGAGGIESQAKIGMLGGQ